MEREVRRLWKKINIFTVHNGYQPIEGLNLMHIMNMLYMCGVSSRLSFWAVLQPDQRDSRDGSFKRHNKLQIWPAIQIRNL